MPSCKHPFPQIGTQQSPIALIPQFDAKDLGVEIKWKVLDLQPVLDAYKESCPRKLKVKSGTPKLRLDNEDYVAVDCHWHFPAEHTLGPKGKQHDHAAEVHVVHVHKDDVHWALQGKLDWCRIAVLGVFVKPGKQAYAPLTLAARADRDPQATKQPSEKLGVGAILPRRMSAIRYTGSLTTPPYSENVTFVIFDTPVTAKLDQLDTAGLENARPLRASNRRYCVRGSVKRRS